MPTRHATLEGRSTEPSTRALQPTYRYPGGAPAPPAAGRRVDVDVEACLTLALLALGCAPAVALAVARGAAFSAETTVCALLLAGSLLLLAHEASARFVRRGDGALAAPASPRPRARRKSATRP